MRPVSVYASLHWPLLTQVMENFSRGSVWNTFGTKIMFSSVRLCPVFISTVAPFLPLTYRDTELCCGCRTASLSWTDVWDFTTNTRTSNLEGNTACPSLTAASTESITTRWLYFDFESEYYSSMLLYYIWLWVRVFSLYNHYILINVKRKVTPFLVTLLHDE